MRSILFILFSAFVIADPEEPVLDQEEPPAEYVARDVKQKVVTPKGVEPENDYNNIYDLLESDSGDNEEDN